MEEELPMELLDLPSEIRRLIYDYSVNGVESVEYYIVRRSPYARRHRRTKRGIKYMRYGTLTVNAGGRWPSLLCVSKQVRHEVFDLVFQLGTFKLACHHPEIVIPQNIRNHISSVRCGYLDNACFEDLYSFANLKKVTCEIFLSEEFLDAYGFPRQLDDDMRVELKETVVMGLDPRRRWTVEKMGYPHVMKMAGDRGRGFALFVLARVCWFGVGAYYRDALQVLVDVDKEVHGQT